MISDARAHPQEDEAMAATSPDETHPGRHGSVPTPGGDEPPTDVAGGEGRAPPARAPRRGRDAAATREGARSRPSLPLVPVLAVLLVLLLAGAGFLWFTRPGHLVGHDRRLREALQAARSGVVDMTSFDYLTLDDDIEQIQAGRRRGPAEEAADQLDSRRSRSPTPRPRSTPRSSGPASPGRTPTTPPC